MKFVLVRHGDPDYTIDSLTPAGWREAKALAKRMQELYGSEEAKEHVFFYSSPLGRARDTAGETMKLLGRTAAVLPTLREFDTRIADPRDGSRRITWDLYPKDWINDPMLYDKDHWWEAPLMATGKDVKSSYDAVCSTIDWILSRHGYEREGLYYRPVRPNHDTVVVFCHMGVSCLILSHLLNCSPCIPWQNMFMPPSSITTFDMEEREEGIAIFRMRGLGDVTHLLQAGLPVSDSGLYGEVYPEPKRRPDIPGKIDR